MRSTTAVRTERNSWTVARTGERPGQRGWPSALRLGAFDLIPSPLKRSDAASRSCPKQMRWSEAVSWAWEELNLRPHPETKIARVPTGSAAREPSLAGHARFSSLVAATGHGGLISNHGLTAMQPSVVAGR